MSVAACSSERWALMHIARIPAHGSEHANVRACSIDGKKYAWAEVRSHTYQAAPDSVCRKNMSMSKAVLGGYGVAVRVRNSYAMAGSAGHTPQDCLQ